ncbi:MAG: ATP-binding protein [Blautia sp.]
MGNRDFLLCGAGAAGPALEGGSVRTGMRAVPGAVEQVELADGSFHLQTIGGYPPKGICGSGIVDLIAQLFLNGWIDIRGKVNPEKSPLIHREDGEYCVTYGTGLCFYQSDIEEFLKTKAAAVTMIHYMLELTGIQLEDIGHFYLAGAFGAHISKESAVTIGMYPDVDRDRLVPVGNSSLEGAQRLLLDRSILDVLDKITEHMEYVQFGAVDNFLHLMEAATAIPHTNLEQYPSVVRELRRRNLM